MKYCCFLLLSLCFSFLFNWNTISMEHQPMMIMMIMMDHVETGYV